MSTLGKRQLWRNIIGAFLYLKGTYNNFLTRSIVTGQGKMLLNEKSRQIFGYNEDLAAMW